MANILQARKYSRYTNSDIHEQIKKASNGEYVMVSEYNGAHKPVKLKHLKCGHIYTIYKYRSFTKNGEGRCPKCKKPSSGNKKLIPLSKFLERFKVRDSKNEYKYLSGYRSLAAGKVEILHKKCNKSFSMIPKSFLGVANRKPRGCPHCNGKPKLNNEAFQKTLIQRAPGYINIDKYVNTHTSINFKHECGTIFSTTPNRLLMGDKVCPKCKKFLQSNLENQLYQFIRQSLPLNMKIIREDRSLINPLEIDILIPELKIAIEFNGLYWHSDKKISKNYHKNKMDMIVKKGYRCIQIFEDEWIEKKVIVQKKLLHLFKIDNSTSIYARKCYIKEISIQSKSKFLNKYHIQGDAISSINLGLYNEDRKLKAVMVFTNSNDNSYTLSRYATSYHNIIIGGFSKLFKYFTSNYKFNEIITYADLRWSLSSDNIYEKTFKRSHFIEPDYSYCKNNKRYHKFLFRKSKIRKKFPEIYSDNLTEKEMMKIAGFNRIYDAGKICYKFTK